MYPDQLQTQDHRKLGGGGSLSLPNNFYLYKAEQNTQTSKMRT